MSFPSNIMRFGGDRLNWIWRKKSLEILSLSAVVFLFEMGPSTQQHGGRGDSCDGMGQGGGGRLLPWQWQRSPHPSPLRFCLWKAPLCSPFPFLPSIHERHQPGCSLPAAFQAGDWKSTIWPNKGLDTLPKQHTHSKFEQALSDSGWDATGVRLGRGQPRPAAAGTKTFYSVRAQTNCKELTRALSACVCVLVAWCVVWVG